MSNRILPEARIPWLKDGKPLAGGLLYTYEPGTTANKATYQDKAKTVAHANPIVLDADGRPPGPIYWDGAYKYVLRTSDGALVYSQDDYGDDLEPIAAEGASLLPNGSFETDQDGDGTPDEWTITTLGTNTIALDGTAGNVYSGGRSLKFTTVDGNKAGTAASGLMPWAAGEVLYLRGATKSSASGLTNAIAVDWLSTPDNVLSSSTLYASATAPTTYTSIAGSATAPANTKYARIRIEGADGGGGTLGSAWFDDLRVEQMAERARVAEGLIQPVLKPVYLDSAQNLVSVASAVVKPWVIPVTAVTSTTLSSNNAVAAIIRCHMQHSALSTAAQTGSVFIYKTGATGAAMVTACRTVVASNGTTTIYGTDSSIVTVPLNASFQFSYGVNMSDGDGQVEIDLIGYLIAV
jgi:hypothetical protein